MAVLVELKGESGARQLEDFDRLQDISGTIAIQADLRNADEARRFRQGQAIHPTEGLPAAVEGAEVRLYEAGSSFIGLGRLRLADGLIEPLRLMSSAPNG